MVGCAVPFQHRETEADAFARLMLPIPTEHLQRPSDRGQDYQALPHRGFRRRNSHAHEQGVIVLNDSQLSSGVATRQHVDRVKIYIPFRASIKRGRT